MAIRSEIDGRFSPGWKCEQPLTSSWFFDYRQISIAMAKPIRTDKLTAIRYFATSVLHEFRNSVFARYHVCQSVEFMIWFRNQALYPFGIYHCKLTLNLLILESYFRIQVLHFCHLKRSSFFIIWELRHWTVLVEVFPISSFFFQILTILWEGMDMHQLILCFRWPGVFYYIRLESSAHSCSYHRDPSPLPVGFSWWKSHHHFISIGSTYCCHSWRLLQSKKAVTAANTRHHESCSLDSKLLLPYAMQFELQPVSNRQVLRNH